MKALYLMSLSKRKPENLIMYMFKNQFVDEHLPIRCFPVKFLRKHNMSNFHLNLFSIRYPTCDIVDLSSWPFR